MSVSIRAELQGDDRRLLQRLRTMSSVRMEDVNEEIAEGLRTSTVGRFRSQISPEGKRWKTSIRAREQAGLTLIHTAALRNSIKAKSDKEYAMVGSNLVYAATHQYGDTRTIQPKQAKFLRFQVNGKWVAAKQVRVTIPARPYLGISEDDMEEIRSIFHGAMGD